MDEFDCKDQIIKLIEAEKHKEAETIIDAKLAAEESLRDMYGFKGLILAEYDRHEEALEYFEKAIAASAALNNSVLKYYKALSLFSIGKQKEGWQTLFQARLENETFGPLCTSLRRFARIGKQLWVKQPPPATIHLHFEAGFGDNILFMRYIQLLLDQGYKVRLETRDNMIKLAKDSFPDIEVMPLAKDFPGFEGIPNFDYHLPMVDLPFVFQTDIDSIPWKGPYIKADPALVEKYRAHRGKIGICWSCNARIRGDKEVGFMFHKSLDFDVVAPLVQLDPSRFVAIQAGPDRFQNNMIVDVLPPDNEMTFADTAALIENLDLVISIDTATVHLAGAMGKPTWLLMHQHLTSFQFMAECPGASWNTASPWYPTMKIFRQEKRGDWKAVIENVKAELKQWLKKAA